MFPKNLEIFKDLTDDVTVDFASILRIAIEFPFINPSIRVVYDIILEFLCSDWNMSFFRHPISCNFSIDQECLLLEDDID